MQLKFKLQVKQCCNLYLQSVLCALEPTAKANNIEIVTVQTTDATPVAKGGVSVTVNKSDGTTQIGCGTTLAAEDSATGLAAGQFRAHNGTTSTILM